MRNTRTSTAGMMVLLMTTEAKVLQIPGCVRTTVSRDWYMFAWHVCFRFDSWAFLEGPRGSGATNGSNFICISFWKNSPTWTTEIPMFVWLCRSVMTSWIEVMLADVHPFVSMLSVQGSFAFLAWPGCRWIPCWCNTDPIRRREPFRWTVKRRQRIH